MEFFYSEEEKKSRYKCLGKLGEGAFGDVRFGFDTTESKLVAIKFISVSSSKQGIPRAIFRELESLRQLSKSHHVVQLIDFYSEETNICLVLEFLPSNLAEIISQANYFLGKPVIKCLSLMLMKAMSFCHAKNIIHRDIKPSNLLLGFDGQLKLGDFGLARVIDPSKEVSLSYQVATRMYRSPELLFATRKYDFSMDIWACGAVIAELFTLTPLFPGANDIDQIFKVFQIMGTPTKQDWPHVDLLPDYNKISFPFMAPVNLNTIIPQGDVEDIIFIKTMLQLNPNNRCNAQEIIKNLYFHQEPFPCHQLSIPIPVVTCTNRKKLSNNNKKDVPGNTIQALSALVDNCFPI